jgi:hypothetical protein
VGSVCGGVLQWVHRVSHRCSTGARRVGSVCGGVLQWAALLGYGATALVTASLYLKAGLGHRLMKDVDPTLFIAAVACLLHLLVQVRFRRHRVSLHR